MRRGETNPVSVLEIIKESSNRIASVSSELIGLFHVAMTNLPAWHSMLRGLSRRDVSNGLEKPMVVEPVHPFRGHELEGFETPPWSASAKWGH